jgi:hypothetical protein
MLNYVKSQESQETSVNSCETIVKIDSQVLEVLGGAGSGVD